MTCTTSAGASDSSDQLSVVATQVPLMDLLKWIAGAIF